MTGRPMAPVDLPYLQVYAVRGRTFAYYRRAGLRLRIKAEPGQEAFPGAYEAARLAWEARRGTPAPRAGAGTLAALIAEYRASPDFRRLAAKSQRYYLRFLDHIEGRFGDLPAAQASRRWVFRLRDEAQDKPRTANYRVAILAKLMSFAIDRGYRPDNPAARIGQLAGYTSFRIWTAHEIATMTGPEAGDIALPILIARYTAQREADVLRLLWTAYDGSSIRLRQGKTGTALRIFLPDALCRVLDATPRTGAVICLTSNGRPWTVHNFRHKFAETRAALGLPSDLHYHGLRGTRATEIVEGGGSDAEVQAVLGLKTRTMVGRYTSQAEQARLTKAVLARLHPEQPRNTKLSSRLKKSV